jgi:hypothetical protein
MALRFSGSSEALRRVRWISNRCFLPIRGHPPEGPAPPMSIVFSGSCAILFISRFTVD